MGREQKQCVQFLGYALLWPLGSLPAGWRAVQVAVGHLGLCMRVTE